MRQPTDTEKRILVFLSGRTKVCGGDIGKELGFGSARLYPALYRLEQESYIDSEWETPEVSEDKPRRRMYFLTEDGHRVRREIPDEILNLIPNWGAE